MDTSTLPETGHKQFLPEVKMVCELSVRIARGSQFNDNNKLAALTADWLKKAGYCSDAKAVHFGTLGRELDYYELVKGSWSCHITRILFDEWVPNGGSVVRISIIPNTPQPLDALEAVVKAALSTK